MEGKKKRERGLVASVFRKDGFYFVIAFSQKIIKRLEGKMPVIFQQIKFVSV